MAPPPSIGDPLPGGRSKKRMTAAKNRSRKRSVPESRSDSSDCEIIPPPPQSKESPEKKIQNVAPKIEEATRKRPRRAAAAAAALKHTEDSDQHPSDDDKIDVDDGREYAEEEAMVRTASPTNHGDTNKEDIPQRRLLNFQIHDGDGHVQPLEFLDSGTTPLYLSGVVLPFSGPVERKVGAKCTIGPLESWWITGYETGTPYIWVCTALAYYMCVRPASTYRKSFGTLWDKVVVLMPVYKALSQPDGGNPDIPLDELVAKISRVIAGSASFGGIFSKDYFCSIGKFIVDQLQSLDANASGEEQVFSGLPVLQALLAEFEKRSNNFSLGQPANHKKSSGALVIHENSTSSAAAAASGDPIIDDDAKLALILQEEENHKANAAYRKRSMARPSPKFYIKIKEDEIAPDYPTPEYYKPEDEETDEYILFEDDQHELLPDDLPRRTLHDWCLYDSDLRFMPLELLPMVTGTESDVEIFGSGVMLNDDGDGYMTDGDNIQTSSEDRPNPENGIRVYLSSVREWMIEFGSDMISITIRTDGAWYRLGKPSPAYSPWYKVVMKTASIGRKMITLLNNAARISRVSFSDVKKTLAEEPEDSVCFISKIWAEVERYLLVHGQVFLQQFHEFPEKKIRESPFATALKDMMLQRQHSKLSVSKKKGFRRGRNLNPRANMQVDSQKKPMRATTTHLINRIWSQYYIEKADAEVPEVTTEEGEVKEVEEVQEQDDEDIVEPDNDVVEVTNMEEDPKPAETTKPAQNVVKWIGESIGKTSRGEPLYDRAGFNSQEVRAGSTLLFLEDEAKTFLLVEYLYGSRGSKCMAHGRVLEQGTETVLGDAANKRELFLTNDCKNVRLDEVSEVPQVEIRKRQWGFSCRKQNAALDEEDRNRSLDRERQGLPLDYFCRALYCPEEGGFFSLPYDSMVRGTGDCAACKTKEGETKTGLSFLPDNGGFRLDGLEYYTNEFVYVEPNAIISTDSKTSEKFKAGRNKGLPAYIICQLLNIEAPSRKQNAATHVSVRRFYRPEDVDASKAYKADIREVLYSEEIKSVPISAIRGKCNVVKQHEALAKDSFQHVFFCDCSFDELKSSVKRLPPNVRLGTAHLDGKSPGFSKGKGKAVVEDVSSLKGKSKVSEDTKKFTGTNKLATLDVFAGCGGLSEGLHQAGVACTKWAIEYDDAAAQAFKLNHSNAEVFCENCNVILRSIMEKGGDLSDCISTPEADEMASKLSKEKREKLPCPGEVDFITGGPPCQGFSGMNRFNQRTWSKIQCEMILAFLSYADYFRPRFFLLENVRNFVSFNKGQTFRLAVACLLEMGYQVRFGVLQAGNYGVSQCRTRAFIWAAAPGETLPSWPEPLHVFSSAQLKIPLSKNTHYSAIKNSGLAAPLRSITVRDAIGDLPPVGNGADKREIQYGKDPESWFQKHARGVEKELYDHICKEMNELNYIRCQRIPKQPGADWRLLKEEKVRLSTGQVVDLVPWCLPNTAARHNQWKGLFGRLDWDGNFPTSVTDPQPMGKVGLCFHPEQDRIVTVRECARSQGFPDCYKFQGNIQNKHKQIGNAVPPPLAKALGMKLKEVVM